MIDKDKKQTPQGEVASSTGTQSPYGIMFFGVLIIAYALWDYKTIINF